MGSGGGLKQWIENAELLESRFGAWPSFHDAEVLAVRLDSGQRSDGKARLELDIHLFAVEGSDVRQQTLATLEFTAIENVELERFGPQNVLFDLEIEERSTADGRLLHVELPSSNGLDGEFDCRAVTVTAVTPHEAGSH